MSTIRLVDRHPFVSGSAFFPRAAFQDVSDGRLSFSALGLLGWLSTEPGDVNEDALLAAGPDSAADVLAALAELERFGYVEVEP